MEKAIFYKEWLKTRRVFWLALIVAVVATAYTVLKMNSLVTLKGVEHLWIVMLAKDRTFVDFLTYIPALIGIAIGIAQMAPEMSHKRLKLTLHLPYPQMRLVALMLLTGILELLIIFALQAVIICAWDLTIITPRMTARVLLTMLPWFFAGFTAYLFVTAICLEGTWLRRAITGLIGFAVLLTFFLSTDPEAYNTMIIVMCIFIAATALLSFGSVIRFKEGRQD